MSIGAIGMGFTGEPITRNLYKVGHDVTVYTRTTSNYDGHPTMGVTVAETAYQVIEAADAIVRMVPNQPEVDRALFSQTMPCGQPQEDAVGIVKILHKGRLS